MAKRKLEIFLDINNEKDLDFVLNNYKNNLICAQVYCTYFGYCTAFDHLFQKMKLDWSDGEAILLRVAIDEIKTLRRFLGRSVPMFLFILNKGVINIFKGVDYIRFEEVAKREIDFCRKQQSESRVERQTYDISELTPEEIEWLKFRQEEAEEAAKNVLARKMARQAMRKRHRAELMVPHLQHMNFVLYWPHATNAHPELYERWDCHNIIMVAREEIKLTKETAEDVLYAGDAPINDASLHVLLSAPALVICFRLLDTDKHFVSLVRKILYEEINPVDDVSTKGQSRPTTAFDLYKSYSLSRDDILRGRREEKIKKRAGKRANGSPDEKCSPPSMNSCNITDALQAFKEQLKENRARRLSEMQRLARQAIEEAMQAKRAEREKRKLELLKSGNINALEEFERSSFGMDVNITVPEWGKPGLLDKRIRSPFMLTFDVDKELSDAETEDTSGEEDATEYFPPSGLLIPGFYAPPNDISKVNGLAILFPKIVSEYVTPEPEFLPPHLLVLIDLTKRYRAIQCLVNYQSAVIHMGIFKMTTPYSSQHISYSVKQFDSLHLSINADEVRLAFMLSVVVDLPLLELMDLNPSYVSRDTEIGEEDCATMFSVNYGDDYPEFEDFESPKQRESVHL